MEIKALADPTLYPAVLEMLGDVPDGPTLDVPAGHGAFAQALLKRGYSDIHCLDINAESFALQGVNFQQYDAANKLPFPDNYFEQVFSIEGIEHFENPFPFVKELCRVLKPGGKLFISTPNTFSVDARLKYLMSGYFPRFRPLMQEPDKVMHQPVDDAHIAPIYFWQLNFFLLQGNCQIKRVSANTLLIKNSWPKRMVDNLIARMIRKNIRKRGFPDHGVTSDAVLFGDCLIIEATKS